MISPSNEKVSVMDSKGEELILVQEVQFSSKKVQDRRSNTGAETSIHLSRSRRTRRPMQQHRHSHIKTVHGIVSIIGWGILLPGGVISARYFKTLTIKESHEWNSIHLLSQMSGFILGTIGWGLGLYIGRGGNSSGMSLHGILGTIIFCLSVIQITLGLRVMAIEDIRVSEIISKKTWRICHGVVGYVLIVLISVNIFEGIKNIQSSAHKWNWSYGVILGAFSFLALCLEVLRRIRFQEID